MQPTAQAVGKKVREEQAPKGAKEWFSRTLFRAPITALSRLRLYGLLKNSRFVSAYRFSDGVSS